MVIYIGLLNGKLRGAFVLLRSLQNTAVVMPSSKYIFDLSSASTAEG